MTYRSCEIQNKVLSGKNITSHVQPPLGSTDKCLSFSVDKDWTLESRNKVDTKDHNFYTGIKCFWCDSMLVWSFDDHKNFFFFLPETIA